MGTSPSPSPPLNPPPSNPGTIDDLLHRHSQYARIRYRSCLALLLACPILIALPPRRLNIYSVGLGGVWVFALDEVLGQSRGRIPWMNPPRVVAGKGDPMPGELDKEDDGQGGKGRSRYAEKVREMVGDNEDQGKSVSEMMKDGVWVAYKERRERLGHHAGEDVKEDGMRRFVEEVVMDQGDSKGGKR